jgi:2-iminobutanoate/2-iminopropanoate deaminase
MMLKRAIETAHAPGAVGPYSQGVTVSSMVFTAGQLGLDPETMKLVEGGVEAQARQALANLEAVLKAGGASLGDVVKVTVFLQDMNDFAAVNAIYGAVFDNAGSAYPARSAVEVAKLPLGGLVEIEAIAVLSA